MLLSCAPTWTGPDSPPLVVLCAHVAHDRAGLHSLQAWYGISGTSLMCIIPIMSTISTRRSSLFLPVCISFAGTSCVYSGDYILPQITSVPEISIHDFPRTLSATVSTYGSSFRQFDVSPKASFRVVHLSHLFSNAAPDQLPDLGI